MRSKIALLRGPGITRSTVRALLSNVSFMKKCLFFLCVIISVSSYGQPLRDINYEYLYSPDSFVNMELRPVRDDQSFTILYNLHVRDTTGLLGQYSVQWEGRALLGDKEGTPLTLSDLEVSRHSTGFEGRGRIELTGAPRYLVAKVVNATSRRAWYFYTRLEENYPVNNFLLRNGSALTQSFAHTNEPVKLGLGSGEWFVSYYNDNFPASAPSFSEGQARVSRVMAVDSLFRVKAGEEVTFRMRGLFLVQKDTNSLEGFAFRSEEDYPQFTKLASLPGPLVYITTRQEYDRLEAIQGNKKAFDRVILSITLDTDRARILMRNYFRRVELANRYFTSYKEGWKTDRGMIYIIFGKPDEVFRFDDREVWRYDNDRFRNISFNFSRSSSLFDPENFVLIRDKKYEGTWYEVIDLWRNARF